MTITMNYAEYSLWIKRFEILANDVRLLGDVKTAYPQGTEGASEKENLKYSCLRTIEQLKEWQTVPEDVFVTFGYVVGRLGIWEKDNPLWFLLQRGGR